MHVLEEEFIANVDKYLEAAQTEKVYIMTKKGTIGILSKPDETQIDLMDRLGTDTP